MPSLFGSPYFGAGGTTISATGTVTLALIEQTVAPRCGPYALRSQSATTAASATTAYFDELKTSIGVGGVTDLYMLRRGFTSGTSVAVASGDRVRVAADYDPVTGAVRPDRAWALAPVAGEQIEFHHLNPATELRPAVVAGLGRCFYEDRVTVTTTSAAAERDLTAKVFWITRPDQVRRFQVTTTGATTEPDDVEWAQPFESAGHVWWAAWPDTYPNTLLVTALRPVVTLVNGLDSTTGPTADTDLLNVDLPYAAAAGHIEAWRIAPARMHAAAEAGYQASQQAAAAEFSRYAVVNRRRRRTGWTLSGPFGESRLSVRAR